MKETPSKPARDEVWLMRTYSGHTTAKAVAAIKAKTAERQVDESPVDLKPER